MSEAEQIPADPSREINPNSVKDINKRIHDNLELLRRADDSEHPCSNCNNNALQALLYDEVTCFKTCKTWLEWRKSLDGRRTIG